jgi:hypothetical protein
MFLLNQPLTMNKNENEEQEKMIPWHLPLVDPVEAARGHRLHCAHRLPRRPRRCGRQEEVSGQRRSAQVRRRSCRARPAAVDGSVHWLRCRVTVWARSRGGGRRRRGRARRKGVSGLRLRAPTGVGRAISALKISRPPWNQNFGPSFTGRCWRCSERREQINVRLIEEWD